MTLTQANGRFTSMLVKRRPFTPDEVGRTAQWAGRSGLFALSAAPGLNEGQRNPYQIYLALDDPRKEATFLAAYPLSVAPVDDDRPFFFRYSAWRELAGLFSRDPAVRSRVPPMEQSLLALFVVIRLPRCCACSCRCDSWPGARRARRRTLFFAGLGIGHGGGIALLQRFGLFLGQSARCRWCWPAAARQRALEARASSEAASACAYALGPSSWRRCCCSRPFAPARPALPGQGRHHVPARLSDGVLLGRSPHRPGRPEAQCRGGAGRVNSVFSVLARCSAAFSITWDAGAAAGVRAHLPGRGHRLAGDRTVAGGLVPHPTLSQTGGGTAGFSRLSCWAAARAGSSRPLQYRRRGRWTGRLVRPLLLQGLDWDCSFARCSCALGHRLRRALVLHRRRRRPARLRASSSFFCSGRRS